MSYYKLITSKIIQTLTLQQRWQTFMLMKLSAPDMTCSNDLEIYRLRKGGIGKSTVGGCPPQGDGTQLFVLGCKSLCSVPGGPFLSFLA